MISVYKSRFVCIDRDFVRDLYFSRCLQFEEYRSCYGLCGVAVNRFAFGVVIDAEDAPFCQVFVVIVVVS